MKNRLDNFLIILISNTIGLCWACLIVGYRLLEKLKIPFSFTEKTKWNFWKMVTAKLYK